MKNTFTSTMKFFSAVCFLAFSVMMATQSSAQNVFSRFDFNTNNLELATVGPDAVYIDPDSRRANGALYMRNNCGSTKGFELTIPNEGMIFDVPSIGMRFRWEKHENFAHFFDRGATSFYIQGGFLFVTFRIQNGITNNGGVTIGPVPTGYYVPDDNQFHEFVFEYRAGTGTAEVLVDGNSVFAFDGPDGRDLVWDSNVQPVVGEIMDGTCDQEGVLDFAEFYLPNESLPVEFLDVQAEWNGTSAQIKWLTTNEVNNDRFVVERSRDGFEFEAVGEVPAVEEGGSGVNVYELEDTGLNRSGTWSYRIRQIDRDGRTSFSETVRLEVDEDSFNALEAFPNPSNGQFQLKYRPGARSYAIAALDGHTVHERQLPDSDEFPITTVDVPGLAPGIYFLVVRYTGRQETIKLVIR